MSSSRKVGIAPVSFTRNCTGTCTIVKALLVVAKSNYNNTTTTQQSTDSSGPVHMLSINQSTNICNNTNDTTDHTVSVIQTYFRFQSKL